MSVKILIVGTLITLIIILGGAVLLTGNEKPKVEAQTYTASDANRPQAQTSETSFDFGTMKVSDIRQKSFVLKNIGTKPLQILNIDSSCNCTFGQLIYKKEKSQEFGMHKQSGYLRDLAPGDNVEVDVIYKPSLMPVYGQVEREVYVTTNDPQNPRLVFSIKANVKQ